MGGFWSVPKRGVNTNNPTLSQTSPLQKSSNSDDPYENNNTLVYRLEDIANEFLNNEAFNICAAEYGLLMETNVAKDLPFEVIN
jgi:hypothetical protein